MTNKELADRLNALAKSADIQLEYGRLIQAPLLYEAASALSTAEERIEELEKTHYDELLDVNREYVRDTEALYARLSLADKMAEAVGNKYGPCHIDHDEDDLTGLPFDYCSAHDEEVLPDRPCPLSLLAAYRASEEKR